MNITHMKQQYGDSWVGPFGVKIHWGIRSVPSADAANDTRWVVCGDRVEVEETEVCGSVTPYTKDEYHELFCEQRADGLWYWRYATQKESDEAVRAAPARPKLVLFGGDPDW